MAGESHSVLRLAAARRGGLLEAHRRAARRGAHSGVGRRRVQLAREQRRRQLVPLLHLHLRNSDNVQYVHV